MQMVFEQNRIAEAVINRTRGEFGSKIGLFGKLFGCWHKRLSRAFTKENISYRTCLHCGARRRFNTQLKVRKPKIFAVSKEKSGGVVVSDPSRIVAVAKI